MSVLVGRAKTIAREWVSSVATTTPGLHGAFFHGSINELPDDAFLASSSDIDLILVLNGPLPATKLGKIIHQDVMLDVTYLAREELQSAELVLGQYHLAGSFRSPGIIMDPTGELTSLQEAVAAGFARREWVIHRRDHARNKVLHGYRASETEPFHNQVIGWLFPAGILCHVLLVAGLKNPTVRRRYLAVRELLADYGQAAFYDTLLELLGCATISPERVEQHLAAVTAAFDAAKQVIKTPFFFASDISDIARPVSIDGSREMIAQGDHREAIFWLVATYSRCQQVFAHDAPDLSARFEHGFRALLHDLGITSALDLQRRNEDVRDALPSVVALSDAIIATNPKIKG